MGQIQEIKKQFMIVEPHAGGWGATDSSDGASGLIAILDGDTYNYSIELLRQNFRYALTNMLTMLRVASATVNFVEGLA